MIRLTSTRVRKLPSAIPKKKAVRMTIVDGALAPKTWVIFRCQRFSKIRELTPERKNSG